MLPCIGSERVPHHAAFALVPFPGEASAHQLVAEMEEERVERVDFAVRTDTLDLARG